MSVNIETLLAKGLLATLPPAEQDQVNHCVHQLKQVISTVDKSLAGVAFLNFTADFLEEVKKDERVRTGH